MIKASELVIGLVLFSLFALSLIGFMGSLFTQYDSNLDFNETKSNFSYIGDLSDYSETLFQRANSTQQQVIDQTAFFSGGLEALKLVFRLPEFFGKLVAGSVHLILKPFGIKSELVGMSVEMISTAFTAIIYLFLGFLFIRSIFKFDI